MSRLLVRNSLANLFGAALPALVTLATIPFIVSRLGDVNYGVLAMVTAIVGSFALIDINITSASVKYVAQYRALGRHPELCQVVTLGALTYTVIGLVGAVLIFVNAEWLSDQLFNVPDSVLPLAKRTLQLAGLGFLFGQIGIYFNSIPQALQRFDASGTVEAVFGTLVALLSVLVLWLEFGLYELVLLRVILGGVHAVTLGFVSWRLIPNFQLLMPTKNIAKQLFGFSAFAYLQQVTSALYAHADKLITGAVVGVAALTYYVIPSTLVSRVLGLTFRLSGVVYPAASELESLRQLDKLKVIYFSATRYIFYINACFVVLICLFAEEILRHWMGEEFASQGTTVLILIALAMLMESTTNLPSMLVDGIGHPRVTGLFSVFHAVISTGVTWLAATLYGIVGVAAGHLVTSAFMGVAFVVFVHRRIIPYRFGEMLRECYLITTIALGVSFVALATLKTAYHRLDLFATLISALLVTLVFASFGFYFVLHSTHRRSIIAAALRKLRTTSAAS